jgi:hypothetical protein
MYASRSPVKCRLGLTLMTPAIASPSAATRTVPAPAAAAALSMITKEKSPMRALFFRDHEISGLRPAAAPSPVSRPGAPGRDLSTSTP